MSRRRSASSKKLKRHLHVNAHSSASNTNALSPQKDQLRATESVHTTSPEQVSSKFEANKSISKNTTSRFKTSLHLYCIVTGLFLAIIGIVLNANGLLPKPITSISSNVGVLAALIATMWTHIERFFFKIWQDANRVRVLFFSFITAFILISGTFLYSNPSIVTRALSPKERYNSHLESAVNSSTPAILTNIMPIKHIIPFCDNANGLKWNITSSGTLLSCSKRGLIMQQDSSKNYAGVNLSNVEGEQYNLVTFNLRIDINFQRPKDNDTWAGVSFSTPLTGNGENFELELASTGVWKLTIEGLDSPVKGMLTINSLQTVDMNIMIKAIDVSGESQNILYCLINNNLVASYSFLEDESINMLSLIVEQPDTFLSSQVLFSNFNLDTQGGSQ